MEDNAIRAITIGVGVFIIVVVLSGIVLYINVAKDMATAVDKSLNSWDDITVSNIMDYKGDIKIKCTGIDFINFLRKNYGRTDIRLTIEGDTDIQNQPLSWWKAKTSSDISEVKLAKINASSELEMKKESINNEYYMVTVKGDVFSVRDPYMTDSAWEMKRDATGRYAFVTNGAITLEIGDYIIYNNKYWFVLGANNGKILILGREDRSEITLNKNVSIDLSEFDDIFSDLDDGPEAVKGSARCLNFKDIQRLIEIDHVGKVHNNHTYYGTSYDLVWGGNGTVKLDGEDDIWLNLGKGYFYWYNKSLKSFKKEEYPGVLPTITVDAFTFPDNDVEITDYLSDTVIDNKMLRTFYPTFLMDFSTTFDSSSNNFIYTAKTLFKNVLKEENFSSMSAMKDGETETDNEGLQLYVRPVITLKSNVKIVKNESGRFQSSLTGAK